MRWMNRHGDELTVEQFDMLISVDDSGALHGTQIVIGKAAHSKHVRKVPLEISLRQDTHAICRQYITTCVAPKGAGGILVHPSTCRLSSRLLPPATVGDLAGQALPGVDVRQTEQFASRAGIRYEPNDKPPRALTFGLGLQFTILCVAGVVLTPAIVVRAGRRQRDLSCRGRCSRRSPSAVLPPCCKPSGSAASAPATCC